MGNDDAGKPQLLVEHPNLLRQTVAGHRIECREWLVEQQHFGRRRKRARNPDPLLLTARKLVRQSIRKCPRQFNQIQPPKKIILVSRQAAQAGADCDILGYSQVREQGN